MRKKKMVEVPEKEAHLLLKNGKCPANNTKCLHLTSKGCSLKDPKLYYRFIKKEGYSCGSYK